MSSDQKFVTAIFNELFGKNLEQYVESLSKPLNNDSDPYAKARNALATLNHDSKADLTINLRKDLHELTWTYKKPLVKGLTERQYLARDAADVRGILKKRWL